MFRTMQTSSAACALYAGVPQPGQWPGRGACGPQGHPALCAGVGWSPACRRSPSARDCPALAVGSSGLDRLGMSHLGEGKQLLMGICTRGS